MSKYHKINGVFKRYQKGDEIPEGKSKGDFIFNEWADESFYHLKDNVWVWKEKVDGMNCRIIIDPETNNITLKGKSDNAQIPTLLQKWFDEWKDKNKDALLKNFPDGVIFYGEGVGPKIQKGKHGFTDYEIILFDVLIDGMWLKHENVEKIANDINLKVVSVIYERTLSEMIKNMTSMKSKSLFGDFQMEGFVGTPLGNFRDRRGNRIITKLKFVDF